MSSGPIVVTPDERPKALDLIGEDITVLASGTQTGSYEIFLQGGCTGISRDSVGDTPAVEELVRIAAAHGATILPPPG